MRYGSLFSGLGAFDIAFERAGMECAYQCEIDKNCNKLLKERFPNVQRYTDVRDVGTDAPPVDLLCAGWPCQDLSIAGRREGLDGERSGLWFECLRVLQETRPKWFVGENVPGLLSSNGGRDFATVLRGLVGLGYCVTSRVLDCQYWGLAQRGKRVFIVASLGSGASSEVLLKSEGLQRHPPSRKEEGTRLAADIAASLKHGGGNGRGFNLDCESGLTVSGKSAANGGGMNRPAGNANELDFCIPTSARCLTARNERIDYETETFVMRMREGCNGGGKGPLISEDLSLTLASANDQTIWHENKSGNLSEADTARSLRAGASHSYQGVGVRRLTPLECERLQGLPDGWTDGFPDSVRYRMIGNSLAVPVVEWIARRIIQASVVK